VPQIFYPEATDFIRIQNNYKSGPKVPKLPYRWVNFGTNAATDCQFSSYTTKAVLKFMNSMELRFLYYPIRRKIAPKNRCLKGLFLSFFFFRRLILKVTWRVISKFRHVQWRLWF